MESEHEMQLALPCIGGAGINSFHSVGYRTEGPGSALMVGVGGNPKFQDQEFIAYSLEPPSFTFPGCCNEP